jgi:hypothetical protein
MSRRAKSFVGLVGAAALCMSAVAPAVTGKSKISRVGTSTEVETSTVKGKRQIVVTGLLESSLPRCERQRSVLLYEAGSSGDITGGAIGHGVSEGGTSRGEFTITGLAPKRIKDSRRFILEAVGRKVKVKGKEAICKRGVSVEFPGNFAG